MKDGKCKMQNAKCKLQIAAGGIAVLLGLVGCKYVSGPSESETGTADAAAERLSTFAGIPPVAGLVKRIGGPHVEVEILVAPGRDPHIFEPTPRQAVALSNARLMFKVGMSFENQLVQRIAPDHPRLTVVDTAAGIKKRPSDEDHDHASGETDPHVWLSPPLLKIMATNITEALCRADPGHAEDYRKNLATLHSELDSLHARIARTLAPYRGQSFCVFHPAFGYFGDAYGLKQEAVEVEGKSPGAKQLQRLIEKARADGVKIIFLQPQFDPRSAEAVAVAIGGTVVPMDDLAEDVLGNLADMAAKVAEAEKK